MARKYEELPIADKQRQIELPELFALLDQKYLAKDKAEVYQYIQERPELWSLLQDATGKVEKYFGSPTKITLEVMTDREYPDEKQLFAMIYTDFEPEEAVKKLGQLDKGWWLKASHLGRGQLEFSLRYK